MKSVSQPRQGDPLGEVHLGHHKASIKEFLGSDENSPRELHTTESKRPTGSVELRHHNKEIIKIRSRQYEHTSQCDGPAWLTNERGCEFLVSVSLME
jgi:hypothetical protein